MGQVETKAYNFSGNNSDLFGNTIERIHSVSIKENKEKDSNYSTYSFETIFTNMEGYTLSLSLQKCDLKNIA